MIIVKVYYSVDVGLINCWEAGEQFGENICRWIDDNFPDIDYSYASNNTGDFGTGKVNYNYSFVFDKKDEHVAMALKLQWT